MQRRDDPPELLPLYDAIAAAPDDDRPRQVLADALSERGDLRGEFIALQLLEARGQASPEQVVHAQRLAVRHRKAWLAELPGLELGASARRLTELHRGFLRRAALTPCGQGADSPSWRMLEVLELTGPCDAATELGSPFLAHLAVLTGVDLAGLERLVAGPARPKLGELGYRGLNLDGPGAPEERRLVGALGRFTALRRLRLAPELPRHHAAWFEWLFASKVTAQLDTLELVMAPPWDVSGLHGLLVSGGLNRLTVVVRDDTVGLRFDRQRLTIELADGRALSRRAQMLRNLVPRFSPFPFPSLSVRVGTRLATVEELALLGPGFEALVR